MPLSISSAVFIDGLIKLLNVCLEYKKFNLRINFFLEKILHYYTRNNRLYNYLELKS